MIPKRHLIFFYQGYRANRRSQQCDPFFTPSAMQSRIRTCITVPQRSNSVLRHLFFYFPLCFPVFFPVSLKFTVLCVDHFKAVWKTPGASHFITV